MLSRAKNLTGSLKTYYFRPLGPLVLATDTIHAPLCPKSLSNSASVPQTEIPVYSGYYTGEGACLSGAYTLCVQDYFRNNSWTG